MSKIDYQVLREAAEKATKGRWAVEFDDEIYSTDGVNHEQIAMVFSENEARDAAFIAAANPATVLALLASLEAKDKRIAELEQRHCGTALLEREEMHTKTLGRMLDELEASQAKNSRVAGGIEAAIKLQERAEVAEKLIAELEAREVKLPELKMLSDYLAEVTMREREDILVGVRLEFHRALKEGGIKIAASSPKGE